MAEHINETPCRLSKNKGNLYFWQMIECIDFLHHLQQQQQQGISPLVKINEFSSDI